MNPFPFGPNPTGGGAATNPFPFGPNAHQGTPQPGAFNPFGWSDSPQDQQSEQSQQDLIEALNQLSGQIAKMSGSPAPVSPHQSQPGATPAGAPTAQSPAGQPGFPNPLQGPQPSQPGFPNPLQGPWLGRLTTPAPTGLPPPPFPWAQNAPQAIPVQQGQSSSAQQSAPQMSPGGSAAYGGAYGASYANAQNNQQQSPERQKDELATVVRGMTTQLAQAMAGGGPSQTVGGLLGAGAYAARGISNEAPIMGAAAESVLSFGKAVVESIDVVRGWNDALHRGNLKFAEFSGSMGAVAAEQESRQIVFDQQRGEARAETAREQAEAKHRLNEALAPMEDAFANMTNKFSALVSNKLADMAEGLGGGTSYADEEREDTVLSTAIQRLNWLIEVNQYNLDPDHNPMIKKLVEGIDSIAKALKKLLKP